MFWHVVLGLLRDGQKQHGYQLMVQYHARSCTRVSAGNFYWELSRLDAQGLVDSVANAPEADTRRIPYEITEKGRKTFDRWLGTPSERDEEFSEWILFADRLDPEIRDRICARREEDLWMRGRMLARSREDLETHATPHRYALRAQLTLRMKHIEAEIAFVEEFRRRASGRDDRRQDTETKPIEPQARRRGSRKCA